MAAHSVLSIAVHFLTFSSNFFYQENLKKVTDQFPEDVEAWIELGSILEQGDLQVGVATLDWGSIKG